MIKILDYLLLKNEIGVAIAQQALGKPYEQNSTYIKIGTDYVTWQ